MAFRTALLCFESSEALFGGSGGSFVGSYAGALTWYKVPVLPLLCPVPFAFTEPKDSVEIPEATVEIDSEDSRLRTLDSEGLRGGSVGVCRGVLPVRGGGRGGSAGEIFGLGVASTAAGWLPSWRVEVGALLRTGGLLIVWRE
jgi:hypothetical protein